MFSDGMTRLSRHGSVLHQQYRCMRIGIGIRRAWHKSGLVTIDLWLDWFVL